MGDVLEKQDWVGDLRDRQQVRGSYLVKEKRLGKTRNGKPFLSMVLADRTGDVPAKVWDQAQELDALALQGVEDLIPVELGLELWLVDRVFALHVPSRNGI